MTKLRTQKDESLPRIPDDISPSMKSFLTDLTEKISGIFRNTRLDFDTIVAGRATTSVVETSSYVVSDDDGYQTIFCDTTAGNVTVTMPLMANNANRKIKIINAKGGTNKVIISPNATDANKLTTDGMAAIWLPKVGDYIEFECNTTIGYWISVSERISCVLRLNTYAGYGSTDTKIMRFTNVDENYGNMFTENHSTGYTGNTKGLEIVVQRSGKYGIQFSAISPAGASDGIGLSLNSNQLTTAITAITVANRLCLLETAAGFTGCVSVQKNLIKGDVIRTHTMGGTPAVAARCGAIVTYLG